MLTLYVKIRVYTTCAIYIFIVFFKFLQYGICGIFKLTIYWFFIFFTLQ